MTELHDGHQADVGTLRLTSRAVEHGMPAFALRVDADGGSLVYSGDTAPCPASTQLAAGCDALLCEADSAGGSGDGDGYGEKVHHTPEDTGATALAGGTGRLILTHLGPFLSPPRRWRGRRAGTTASLITRRRGAPSPSARLRLR